VAQAALSGPSLDAHLLSRSVARCFNLTSEADRHAVDTAALAVVALEEALGDRHAGALARGLVSSSSAAPPSGGSAPRGGRPPVYSPTLDWERPQSAQASAGPYVVSDEDPEDQSQDRLSDVEP
jgi:hypothetical protein